MKFGKHIVAQQERHDEFHYVNYKLLKQDIKKVVDGHRSEGAGKALEINESVFEAGLSNEIRLVNECFERNCSELLTEIANIAESLNGDSTQAAIGCGDEWSAGSTACASTSTAFVETGAWSALGNSAACLQRLVDVLSLIDKLRKYAVWNAVAVVKILKKRQKQTGLGRENGTMERAAWLSRQSFFSGADFAELHAKVDSLGQLLVLKLAGSDSLPETNSPAPAQRCPICLEDMSDTVELSCSHRFCWKCYVLGPIAYQPGEYRISQCPICRAEASLGSQAPQHHGALSHFLRTYFPRGCTPGGNYLPLKNSLQAAHDKEENEAGEMADAVQQLMQAVVASEAKPRVRSTSAGSSDAPKKDSVTHSALPRELPTDFFSTLPPCDTTKSETTMKAAQQLEWLQRAGLRDPFCLDGPPYCALCSEALAMEAVVTTPCKHHFHKICVQRLDQPNCPICEAKLPFECFLPAEHPLVHRGFRVVSQVDYRPQFPGGPSRLGGGWPLHQPPPESLYGPGGSVIKSYLHRIPCRPRAEIVEQQEEGGGLIQDPAGLSSTMLNTRSAASSAASSASESASEGSEASSGEEDAEPQKRWLYHALGKMRRVDAGHKGREPIDDAMALGVSAQDDPNSKPKVLCIGKHI